MGINLQALYKNCKDTGEGIYHFILCVFLGLTALSSGLASGIVFWNGNNFIIGCLLLAVNYICMELYKIHAKKITPNAQELS